MQGNRRIVDALNDLLTMELTAINQYFLHSKMLESAGYKRLARRFREIAMTEMKDAEHIVDRILYFEGVPNLQRLEAVTIGETPAEQLRLALETERRALAQLAAAVKAAEEEGDVGTREFLAGSIGEEEEHADWLETQIELLEAVGEQNYLAQQIRD